MKPPDTFDELGTEIINMLQELTESVSSNIVAALSDLQEMLLLLHEQPLDTGRVVARLKHVIGLIKNVNRRI